MRAWAAEPWPRLLRDAPVLAIVPGALGPSAWAAKANHALIPVLLGSAALVRAGDPPSAASRAGTTYGV